MALLSADSFNRAYTGAPGSTDGAGSLDPRAWTIVGGSTFGTISNRMAVIAFGTGFPIIHVDLATADVDLQVTEGIADDNGFGLVCRFTDANNYIAFYGSTSTTTLRLIKRVSGSDTTIASGLGNVANGDVLRLVANGNSISVYKNGTLLGASPYTESFNNTATKHGIRMQGDYTTQGADDWSANSTTVAATVTGTQATETDTATSGVVPVDTFVTGSQAIETDSAPVGSMTGAFTVVGGMALESDVGRSGFAPHPIAHTCARRVWLELGALSIDLHNETGGWFVTSFDPGSPAIREVVNVRPDQDGIDDLTRFMGARVVSADITALTAAGAIIDDVAVSFAPFMVPSVRPELHYVLDRPGLPERVLTVRASQYAFKVDNDYQRDIQLQWVASDPVAYDPETHTATAWAGSSIDAGRTYDLTYDRTYPTGGAASPTTGHLYNAGDVPVRPLLKIWGPATGPAVTFTGAGGDGAVAFVDSYTISGGHYIEVDCDQRAAYLDGHRAQSVLAFLDWSAMTTAGWPTILPRLTATMTYTATTTTDATQVIAYWHDGYLA